MPLLIQAWGNHAYAQIKSQSAADSAAAIRRAQVEQQKLERQRQLDSSAKARQYIADSTMQARRALLEAQQIERQRILDSTREARIRVADSMRAERNRITDSIKSARAIIADSIAAVRKQRTDSLEAVRKYRNSKRYQDSVSKVRQAEIDERKAVQQAYYDSIRAERKRITDSTIAVRQKFTDSIKAARQIRSDSMAALRKYRESKRYRDSVAIVRQGRLDSMRQTRQLYNDSLVAARKQIADSMTAARTHIRDSITAVRKAYIDSLTKAREARADSLAKLREKREKEREIMAKDRERRKQMALELKIKKKREAWSNEQMLKKKWSLPRRVIQNTFTRYNYFFNARNKMNEALRNMQRTRRENYDSLLALFPFDPDRDSSMLSADMDSIIQKSSVGIQIHDPRTKWSDDLYLLMGQAYYYKGDYKNAEVTFKYIVSIKRMLEEQKRKQKKKRSRPVRTDRSPSIAAEEKKNLWTKLQHRTAHNEGLLWLIRTYTQANEPEQAESVMELLAADPKFPEHLKGRLALEKSFYFLKQGNEEGATEQLNYVVADKNTPNWLRMRAAFINGQLHQQNREYEIAAQDFKKVIDLHPKIEMDFYSRKHMAYSLMYAGGDQDEAIASLKSMLRDGKYLPYYEQIYFVLGRLAANSNNTKDALTYLQKSIEAPKSTDRQKAVSYATIGDIHYMAAQYTDAKKAYDSAAYLAASAPGEQIVEVAFKRSQALDKVTSPLSIIYTQDSLLQLAALPEREQRQVVRRYIRRLEQERLDSIFRAENATPNIGESGNTGSGDLANWYFSNPVLIQQGMNEFKRKWGNRKLADNWRRSSASGFNAGAEFAGNTSEAAENPDLDANGLPTEESLMAAIPNTKERQDESRQMIQRAYTDLGTAYLNLLEDYPRATETLDTLDKLYPNHPHQAEVLYLRYLTALRQNRLDEAAKYTERLQSEYPDSEFAKLIRPTEENEQIETNVPVSVYYDNTYDLLEEKQFKDVIQRAIRGRQIYNDSRFQARFTILEATAHAGLASFDQADSIVTKFIGENPSDSLVSWAQAIKEYVKNNRPVIDSTLLNQQNAGALDSLLPPPAAEDSAAKTEPIQEYTYNPREPHLFIFVFNEMETRVMGIRAALSDYINMQYSDEQLEIGLEVLDEKNGFVYVKSFENWVQARNFIRKLKANSDIFREFNEGEYQLMVISEKNYQKLLVERDMIPYSAFYKSKYR